MDDRDSGDDGADWFERALEESEESDDSDSSDAADHEHDADSAADPDSDTAAGFDTDDPDEMPSTSIRDRDTELDSASERDDRVENDDAFMPNDFSVDSTGQSVPDPSDLESETGATTETASAEDEGGADGQTDTTWFEASTAASETSTEPEAGANTDPDSETEFESNGETASKANRETGLEANSSGSLFDEGFGEALQNVDSPNLGDGPDRGTGTSSIAGFSDVDFELSSPDDQNFDDDPDSSLPRIDLGIDGLDRMIHGGIPERSLMVTIGSAGTGKTTFGLQFLNHCLEQGESAVFITLEESRRRVIDSATEKGFPFDEYVAQNRLAIVDIDPVEMTNSLASIRNELPRLVEEFGAERLVLDSVSLLEMMYDDRATRRNEIYDFTKGLKEAGVTALLTSEASQDTAYASRHGIVEYLTDAVFVLQYVRPDDFRETRLAVEIQKIRDANHSREKKPYELTDEGISVYQQANLF